MNSNEIHANVIQEDKEHMELISDPLINGITQELHWIRKTNTSQLLQPSTKSVWKEMFEALSESTNDHSEEWDIFNKEMEYLESFVCQDEHRANTWGPRLVKGLLDGTFVGADVMSELFKPWHTANRRAEQQKTQRVWNSDWDRGLWWSLLPCV